MALYIFDLTLKYSSTFSEFDIINALKPLCKKFGFQQEIGEHGYRHYQIRISLIKKTTQNNLRKLLSDTVLKGCHISITSNNCNDVYHYVNKEQTRVEGTKAYTDKSPPPPEMTDQLKDFLNYELYPWQEEVADIAKETDNRKITFIYDPNGNNGKSILCEFLEWNDLADEIAMCNSFEDISSYICSRRQQGFKSHCYIVDMPRAMKKEKLYQFYSGLESIKNGICFDKRYSASKIRFNRPQIIVFTNVMPQELDSFSKDRWQIKLLNNVDKSLTDITDTIFPKYETSVNEFDTD